MFVYFTLRRTYGDTLQRPIPGVWFTLLSAVLRQYEQQLYFTATNTESSVYHDLDVVIFSSPLVLMGKDDVISSAIDQGR